jgi:hypothetical protein
MYNHVMRKLVIVILWVLSVAGAGFMGLRYGQDTAPTPSPAVQIHTVHAPALEPAASERDPLQELIDAGRLFAAIELALSRLSQVAGDHSLRFSLSELYEETHQFDAAISELLVIRSLSLDETDLASARREIDRILRAADERFRSRRATAEAISFFERQTVQEPSYDLHRYFLAKWLLASGDTETADRIVRELGLAGVTNAEHNELLTELNRLSSTLPVRRQGNSIYADVEVTTPSGQATLTLLVDTGASLTAISHYQLRDIGAIRTPHQVRAQTANGMIDIPVFELQSISGGPLTLEYFLVGSLTELPDNVDGLLGLDFLDQLPEPFVNAR